MFNNVNKFSNTKATYFLFEVLRFFVFLVGSMALYIPVSAFARGNLIFGLSDTKTPYSGAAIYVDGTDELPLFS